MAPETRSRGVPPPSRVYHSSPALQQAQFPSRRKVVRTYGKRRHEQSPSTTGTPSAAARDPRQKTLTQIDFVSSSMLSEAHALEFSDNDEGESSAAADKENQGPEDIEDGQDDSEPIHPAGKKRRAKIATAKGKDGKRRRTLGDGKELQQSTDKKTKKKKDASRRRTLGDVPNSNYHTQTLTQFLSHHQEVLIKDSEDDDDDDDGFEEWLQASNSPTTGSKSLFGGGERREAPPSSQDLVAASEHPSSQSSIVPKTPTKRRIRYEIPSSSQQTTPASRMIDRYGAPDEERPSPSVKSGKSQKIESVKELTGKPKLSPGNFAIEDSLTTESWSSSAMIPPAEATPLKDITEETTRVETARPESSSATELMSTPTGPQSRRKSLELGQATPTKASPVPGPTAHQNVRPVAAKTHVGLVEIPDSDEEDEGFSEDEGPLDDKEGRDEASDKENQIHLKPTNRVRIESDIEKEKREGYVAGPETQFAMDILDSFDTNLSGQAPPPQAPTRNPLQQQSSSVASLETAYSSPKLPPLKTDALPTKAEGRPQAIPRTKPTRKPNRHVPSASQTQPLESQRVAFATIEGFGQHSDRTDVIVVVAPSAIDPLASGHNVDLWLPYKIPNYVERFWLFDGTFISYGVCIEPGRMEKGGQGAPVWRYHVTQMYELNDPKDQHYIQAEGWFVGMPRRYEYLPPTGVSELFSNLRFALFDSDEREVDADEQETQITNHDTRPALPPLSSALTGTTTNPGSSFSESQQVEAQLRSDIAQHPHQQYSDPAGEDTILVPSTPLKNRRRDQAATFGADAADSQQPHIRPSQATTVSQVSTPEKQQQQRICPPPPTPPRRPQHQQSSSSVRTFIEDIDGSTPSLMSNPDMSLHSSQLLTKSQMISDSLLRDDVRVPLEIWDSD